MHNTNTIYNNIVEAVVSIPNLSKDKWLQILESKEIYIMHQWKIKNPDSLILSYSDLMRLVATNRSVQLWYSDESVRFSQYKAIPAWVIGDSKLMEKWGLDNSSKIMDYKKSLKNIESARLASSLEYKERMKELNGQVSALRKQFNRDNPMIAIDHLTVDNLPPNLAQAMFDQDPIKHKVKLQLALNGYKLELANKYKNGSLTLEQLLEALK